MPTDVEGTIRQFSLPEFENYNYQYQLRSQTLLAKAKIDLYRYKNLMPFITGGLGIAWNTFKDYDEDDLPDITPRDNPNFRNNTHSDFAYVLGAGLDYILTDQFWLTLEYNYGYLGEAQSTASNNYAHENFATTVTANTLLLNITYFLG